MALSLHAASWGRPHPGEQISGDAAVVVPLAGGLVAAVIDGLGHGPAAAAAAQAARRVVEDCADLPPARILLRCHEALKATRGAAMAVLRLERAGSGVFAGVGNVAFLCRTARPVSALSHAGVVGQKMRKVEEYSFPLSPGDLLCLCSDGLSSRLELPSPAPRDLEGAACALVRAHGRLTDDATALLALALEGGG